MDVALREELSDEVIEAAIIYRKMEKEAYRSRNVAGDISRTVKVDPELEARIKASWKDLETDILEKFKAMMPENRADRDKGPKVYEVVHEMEVARESFLIGIHEMLFEGRVVDPDAVSNFTRRRLGMNGDIEGFYRDMGLLSEPEEITPEI